MIAIARDQVPPQAMNTFPTFTTFNVVGWLESMKSFYNEAFNIVVEPKLVRLPDIAQATGAGIVVSKLATIEGALAFIKSRTPKELMYRYVERNLDEYIDIKAKAARPDRPYAVWCAPAVEATDQAPELHNLSYDGIKKLDVPVFVANALEYWLLFAWHLWATGRPLDIKSVTLTGSLGTVGVVVRGYWNDDRAYVDYCGRSDSDPFIRARQVVLPPLS